MEEGRDFQILRAFMKDKFRESGFQFKKNFKRDLMAEVKDFNVRHGFTPPIKPEELLKLYIEVLKELTSEYFQTLENIQTELKKA